MRGGKGNKVSEYRRVLCTGNLGCFVPDVCDGGHSWVENMGKRPHRLLKMRNAWGRKSGPKLDMVCTCFKEVIGVVLVT